MTRLILLLALLLALAVPAVAKEKYDDRRDDDARKNYQQQRNEDDDRDDRDPHKSDHYRPGAHDGDFSSAERNLIRSWLQEQDRREVTKHPTTTGLPPGLQKKVERGKALPPGWQKKLARGGHLEQEYYSVGRPLPDDLLRRLPPPPPGSEILRVEDQILRLDAATRTILDVFGLGGY